MGKRPQIGTEVIVSTSLRWGKGKVVGHAHFTTNRRDHGVFIVDVKEWHKGKPHRDENLVEKILQVLGKKKA
jgi:hypothetical protein